MNIKLSDYTQPGMTLRQLHAALTKRLESDKHGLADQPVEIRISLPSTPKGRTREDMALPVHWVGHIVARPGGTGAWVGATCLNVTRKID